MSLILELMSNYDRAERLREADALRLAREAAGPGRPLRARLAGWLRRLAGWLDPAPWDVAAQRSSLGSAGLSSNGRR